MATKSKYRSEAANQICSCTLGDIQQLFSEGDFIVNKSLLPYSILADLVTWSPSKGSNLGEKLSRKISRHIDEVVNDLTTGLDVKKAYFFSTYSTKKEKKDLKEKILSDNSTFIALNCNTAFLESLYVSIRNALAHGNVVKKQNFYYLYSVSSSDDKKQQGDDRNVSFLLKIRDLNKLSTYMEVFNKYNGEQ